jgi:hypothetical protein
LLRLGEPLAGRLFPLAHIALSADQPLDIVPVEVVIAALSELHRAQPPFAGEFANGIRVDAEHGGDLFGVEKSSLDRGAYNGQGDTS